MKIRMTEASIRLRLRRSEVERFRSVGEVAASIPLPERTLHYRLRRGEVAQPTVSFRSDTLEVVVPAVEGDDWASGPKVGIYGKSGGLDILVEKDFRRTSAPSPDDDDRYPNPRAAKSDS
jgi:hypothetical protein